MFSCRITRSLQASKPTLKSHIRLNPQSRAFSQSLPAKQVRYQRFGGQTKSPWDFAQWNTRTKVMAAIVATGGVYYVSHLEQVPETGRWRFMDVSPKMEAALGEEARKQLREEFAGKTLPPNHQLTRHIHRVVSQILEANGLGSLKSSSRASVFQTPWEDPFDSHTQHTPSGHGREWELLVVKDDSIANAMTSFGSIVVFTGILPYAKNEEGLAAIIGHEIGHSVARHNLERYSSNKIFLAAATLLAALGLDFGVSQLLSTLLLELPNSRQHELEADAIGLQLISRACYDPRSAPEVFERMEQIDKNNRRLNVNFLYTHPTFSTRIERLNKLLPQAYDIRAASPACSGLQDGISGFYDAIGLGKGRGNTVWGWA